MPSVVFQFISLLAHYNDFGLTYRYRYRYKDEHKKGYIFLLCIADIFVFFLFSNCDHIFESLSLFDKVF